MHMSRTAVTCVHLCVAVCLVLLAGPAVAQVRSQNETAAATAAAAAGAADAGPAAATKRYYDCTLAVKGYGDSSSSKQAPPRSGIQSASFSCRSTPPGLPNLSIGYNRTLLRAFAARFTGVRAVPSSECQRQAGSVVDGSFKPVHALLYFCGMSGVQDVVVRLQQPVVEGVWLDVAPSNAKPGWDSALLYVGGNASVAVIAGRLQHNNAGTPLLLAGSAHASISSTVITGNAQGGFTLQANASARISSSNITNNTAGFGAGLYAMGSARVVLMHGTQAANNTARNKGGGVYAKGAASVVCESGSAIDSNRAWQDGAGMTLEDSAKAVLRNCSVSHNIASGSAGGGILASDNSTVELVACKLAGNQAGKEGGGVALQADSDKCKSGGLSFCRPSMRMTASSVHDNSASVQGGALYVGPGALAVVSGSILRANKARNGGGVHLRGNGGSAHAAELTVERDTLLAGNAAENAGAINVYGDDQGVSKCVVRVSDSVITGNTASQGGGGIVANAQCSVLTERVVMRGNAAGKVGGAFSVAGAVTWPMVGVQLLNNTAQMGGAGYLGENASVLISSSSLVEGNTA